MKKMNNIPLTPFKGGIKSMKKMNNIPLTPFKGGIYSKNQCFIK